MSAEKIVAELGLQPHPEGGHYREVYRAAQKVVTPHGPRSASTAIYFLLAKGQVSRLHRIKSDELWHHYAGGTLHIHDLSPDGTYTLHRLGTDVARGEQLQVCVPAGHWFGAAPAPESEFVLSGCTVAPGFEFSDLEFADRDAIVALHPASVQWGLF